MRFARWVFLTSGIYGLLVLTPMYFTEARYGLDHPPAVTHPEFYYGFLGVAIAWQVTFLLIASDPARYRPIMLAAVIEKASFAIAVPILYSMGRSPAEMLVASMIDAIWAIMFTLSYWQTAGR
jgi:hypothetical protein